MAVIRQSNWLGQQRVDVPHLRGQESAVAGDFDVMAGAIVAGDQAYVVSGFEVIVGSAGIAAPSMVIRTAGALLLHPQASDSGTIFRVPSDRADEVLGASNTRVTGSFTASSTNYVGIDLRRTADATTADLVQFMDEDTGLEKAKTVPLARTLDYVFVVSTQDFDTTPGILAIAKVVTDASNNIVSVEDARSFFGRLGKGGSVTDQKYAFPWSGGRTEVTGNTVFTDGDKTIGSLKDWMDAAMTRMWELGGGEYWYSGTADRNVRMIRLGSATVFTSTGDWFEYVANHLHWRGLAITFDNSAGFINEIKDQATDLTDLTLIADGECIYVDIDRSQNLLGASALQAVKTTLSALGTPVVPGSRYVIAYRYGSYIYTRDGQFFIGMTGAVATTTTVGTVMLNIAAGAPSAPVVPAINGNGSIIVTETTASNNFAVQGVGATTTGSAVQGGAGLYGLGGNSEFGAGGYGLRGRGGNVTDTAGGAGGRGGDFIGGNGTGAAVAGPGLVAVGGTTGVAAAHGHGAVVTGGTNAGGAGAAGDGIRAFGGGNTTGAAGKGGTATGGDTTTGAPGVGWEARGGNATSGNTVGGRGLYALGGAGFGVQVGGEGFRVQGGSGGASSGGGGVGAYVLGGDASAGNGDGGTAVEAHGGTPAGSGVSGKAIYAVSPTNIAIHSDQSASSKPAFVATVNTGSIEALPFQVKDGVGSTRNFMSRLGFWTNKVAKFNEEWLMMDMGTDDDIVDEAGAPSTKWATQLNWNAIKGPIGANDFSISEPSSSYPSSYLNFGTVGSLSGPGDASRIATLRRFVPPPNSANLALEMEFDVSMGGVSNTDVVYVGCTSDTTNFDSNATTVAFRYYGNGAAGGVDTTTNWYALTRNGSGAAHAAPGSSANSTVTDTGVAISTAGAPLQRMRIEFIGSAVTGGSTTIKFYIDEALVATHTTDIGSSPMYFFARSARELVVAASNRLKLGPVGIQWARQLNVNPV